MSFFFPPTFYDNDTFSNPQTSSEERIRIRVAFCQKRKITQTIISFAFLDSIPHQRRGGNMKCNS